MKRSSNNKKDILISYLKKILPFIFLFLFMVLVRINSFNLPYERDEGEYAYIAYFSKQGLLPYRDVFDQKPPLIFLIYYVAELINPGGTWGPRFLALISTFVSAIFLYLIGKKEFGKRVGLMSMWLFAAMLIFPPMTPFAGNTEIFMLTPLLGAFCIYTYNKKQTSLLFLLIFGVCGFLAIFIKPICAPIILFLLVIWIISSFKKNRSIQLSLKALFPVFLGFSIPLTISVLLLFFKGILRDFIQNVIVYNFEYSKTYYSLGIGNLFVFLFYMFFCWTPVLLLNLYFYIFCKARRLFYFGLIASSFFLIYQSPIYHHYIQVIPFLAIPASLAWENITNKIQSRFVRLVFTLTIIFIPIAPYAKYLFSSPEKLNRITYGAGNLFIASVEVSKLIEKATSPEDTVLIFGQEPQILYYSKRKSASRFIYCYPLIIPTKSRKEFEDLYINDIIKNKPKIIVYSPLIDNADFAGHASQTLNDKVDGIIDEDYEVMGSFVESSGWRVSLHDNASDKNIFTLYKRKT